MSLAHNYSHILIHYSVNAIEIDDREVTQTMPEITQDTPEKGSTAEVFTTFLRLGLTSFGGPVAHIGYFRKEIVEKRRWISENQFSQLIAISQFLPGPASSQLGFCLGLLRAGVSGAIAAFLAFTLPSVLILIGFASSLSLITNPTGAAAIHGLKLVACAVVADAVIGMSKKLCPDIQRRLIALIAALGAIFIATNWMPILIVLAGACAGVGFCRERMAIQHDQIQVSYSRKWGLSMLTAFIVIFIGLVFFTDQQELAQVAHAFYEAGSLVFGGGHVVLPLLENSVVSNGWISSEDFLAGYGASQAIPGPMFAFAAYLGAIIPTEYSPWLGAVVALLCMFLPGFLLILAALPFWQLIAQNPIATNALAGVNASVVGILAATLYDPIVTTGITSLSDLAIVLAALVMLTICKYSPLYAVIGCVSASIACSYF